jgi:hypothetical protein
MAFVQRYQCVHNANQQLAQRSQRARREEKRPSPHPGRHATRAIRSRLPIFSSVEHACRSTELQPLDSLHQAAYHCPQERRVKAAWISFQGMIAGGCTTCWSAQALLKPLPNSPTQVHAPCPLPFFGKQPRAPIHNFEPSTPPQAACRVRVSGDIWRPFGSRPRTSRSRY